MKIVWSPEAVEDLVSLRAYIAEDSPATAQRTVRLIIGSIEQLLPDNPLIGRAGHRAPANLSFRGHPASCPIGSSEQRSKSCASIMRRDVGLTVFDRPLPRSSADRSFHSRGRSRVASRNRTPTPPPLSAMNSTASSACRTATFDAARCCVHVITPHIRP
jgi:plasmid stabilization system protein ParE